MKLTFYKSAGVLIESGGSRLLCDPWLEDGAYYGAWAHVPPCEVDTATVGNVDGIYISHIHPDHLHESTLAKFPKTTPVFIHQFAFPYLRDAIAALGFRVVEVANGESVGVVTLDGMLQLTIYAADNCDPSLCGQFFGCDAKVGANRPGSVQIDSMAVISDGTHTIVNVNDCPVDLAGPCIEAIKARFGRPDLLLTNYVGAGPYPQCFAMPDDERLEKAAAKREQFLAQAERYIKALEPAAFMPFAGTYTLAGKLSALNRYRGVCSQAEAAIELGTRCPASRPVLLETGQSYDITNGFISGRPAPALKHPEEYAAALALRKMDYELSPVPESWRLLSLLKIAGQRFVERCGAVGFHTDTKVYVAVDDYTVYRLPTPSTHGRAMRIAEARNTAPHLILHADPRLLAWLLTGYAHWQDASVGSHIMFERRPDVFERGLEFCLNDLHV